jgi:O-ureido-D-serine cyclo-ligase
MEAEAVGHMSRLVEKGGHVIVQPYFDSVDRDGETDLIYFDRRYSHAIRKSAMLMQDGTVNVPTLEFRKARVADEDERAVASAALDAAVTHLGLDRPLLYGRVDLIRDDDGRPVVLELDICEPSLNLPFGEGSAMRFAQVLAKRVGG